MKVLITILFTSLFSAAFAQSGIAFRAEVGGSYRIINSQYPFLNDMYNQHELTKISGGVALEYFYQLSDNWMLQGGVGLQTKGFRTNISEEYLGEFNGGNTFLVTEETTQIDQDFIRVQVPLTASYIMKSSNDWHVHIGLGPSMNYNLIHSVRPDVTENENQESSSYGRVNEWIPGIQAHFGWRNEMPTGNDLLFLIRYDQDLQPALDAPIKRYLYSFNFAFYYWLKV